MRGQSPLARFCAAAYCALLYLYPPRFRREYGAEMAQLFNDLCRDARRRNGTWGVMNLFVRAVFDTIYNSIGEWAMTLRKDWGKTLLTLTGFAAMGAVWIFMFGWMLIYSSLFLVPWDATLTRPLQGSLAQLANDFFDGPGMSILSFVVLAINAVLFARAVRAGADAVTLPWKFAIVGLIFIGGSWALMTLGIHIGGIVWPHPVGRGDPGFHRSVFPALMVLIAFLLYLKLLLRFGRRDETSAGFGTTPVY
jgi:hypothetical protein